MTGCVGGIGRSLLIAYLTHSLSDTLLTDSGHRSHYSPLFSLPLNSFGVLPVDIEIFLLVFSIYVI